MQHLFLCTISAGTGDKNSEILVGVFSSERAALDAGRDASTALNIGVNQSTHITKLALDEPVMAPAA
ncbi:hypothetical protein [Atlantibacter hermannii]|uniref:hypothetical protein n=1 Tax=Atlantibacter hermannii TaxID=565 RepID=UPI0028B25465|nr:hypothetical protein [Atlantibacter hermannii]